MPAIEVSGLSKSFGPLSVLQGVDLRLQGFQRLAVLGPSGAGKSTLLRVIAGLETQTSGSIFIDGVDVTQLTPDRRQLALMSQDYALYPQLNVRRNLETALLSLRLDRQQSAARCDEALVRFRIQHVSGQLPSQLSGGQAQRVALAKAIIRRPRLLLLDEPFSQLDGPLRDELRDLLCDVVEHYQIPLIFVTHDPLDAMRLASQVAILHAGKIEQVDAPAEVYQSPLSRAAAELMSPWGVNWLPPKSIEQYIKPPSEHCGLGPGFQSLHQSLGTGQEIGFRPELTRLEAVDVVAADCLCIPVIVERTAYLGFAYLLQVKDAQTSFRCLVAEPSKVGEQRMMIVPPHALLCI